MRQHKPPPPPPSSPFGDRRLQERLTISDFVLNIFWRTFLYCPFCTAGQFIHISYYKTHKKKLQRKPNSNWGSSNHYLAVINVQGKKKKAIYYEIKTRRAHVTIVAVEKHYILHIPIVCVCSLKYPAWNAHAPYCHLLPLRLYCIFHIISPTARYFENKLLNIKCMFVFPLQILSEKFLFRKKKKKTERHMIKTVMLVFM